ncbi:MAG: hypothetical protein KAI66_03700, partial [Lentisphaeria bacterium]|nr:hypothetical protein [Lentisphaeria bacterium]
CPKCDESVPALAVDFKCHVAKCAACGEEFEFADQLRAIASACTRETAKGRIGLPKGVKLFDREDGFRISRRWFSAKQLPLIFFAIFWNTCVILWFTQETKPGIGGLLIVSVIGVPVGILLGYSAVATCLNTTRITVADFLLTIRHGPIPVPGEGTVHAKNITQLYSEKRESGGGQYGTVKTYFLHAVTDDEEDHTLLDCSNKIHILYIEQELERFLDISDTPMPDEIPSYERPVERPPPPTGRHHSPR